MKLGVRLIAYEQHTFPHGTCEVIEVFWFRFDVAMFNWMDLSIFFYVSQPSIFKNSPTFSIFKRKKQTIKIAMGNPTSFSHILKKNI